MCMVIGALVRGASREYASGVSLRGRGGGSDFLELDVLITKDNVPVVMHDALIDGIRVYALTLAELKEYDCGSRQNPLFKTQIPVPGARVPTLDEVFDLARDSTVQFNVEMKIFADRPELTPGPEAFTGMILDPDPQARD